MPKKPVDENYERNRLELERLRSEWKDRLYRISVDAPLMKPETTYCVLTKASVLKSGLSESEARTVVERFEAEYPDGLPPDYFWDRMPERNKREIQRILDGAARQLYQAHLDHLAKKLAIDPECPVCKRKHD